MTARSAFLFLLAGVPLLAEMPAAVSLPKPETHGGKPLMQALSQRKSEREFATRDLPAQTLSNLLWAGFGINRADGRRTAPSAMNRQTVDVYVVKADGAFLYDAAKNALLPVAAGDLRAATGTQSYAGKAPLNLVYVSDYAKMPHASAEEQAVFGGAETGFIGQNVYLFCASEGLATVIRASIDKSALARALKLRPEQHIVLAQTVGYPLAAH
jgi:nitroreductase